MKNKIEISFPEQSAGADFGDRLVTLCDGRPGVRSTMHVEISEPADEALVTDRGRRRESALISSGPGAPDCADFSPEENPPTNVVGYAVLDFISSDETLDRCGEIISAAGWRLESYRRNPVFQNAHQYGDIIFTLGRALITEVRSRPLSTLNSLTRHSGATAAPLSTYLFQRIQFATEANPMARIAYALYKGKFLNAVSVGFIPLRWEDGEGVEGRGSRLRVEASARQAGVEGGGSPHRISSSIPDTRHPSSPTRNYRRRYLEQELLEVSAVGIPANPNALQLGLKAGAIQKSDLQELLDMLRTLCDSKPQFPSPLPSPQGEGNRSQLSTPNSQLAFGSHLAVPDTTTSAFGVRGYEAQWLQLARAIRDVMRGTQNVKRKT